MKQIVENYKYGIRKIIRTITGGSNEDIEQEVYIKAWSNIKNYNEQGKFRNWVNRITANVCKDYLKSSEFKNSVDMVGEESIILVKDSKNNPEEKFLMKQRQSRILQAVDSLDKKHRQVVILYEFEDLSYEEISKITRVPVGTVKSRLYNARKELSIKLKDLI